MTVLPLGGDLREVTERDHGLRFRGELPMRRLNARRWGTPERYPLHPSDPKSLGSCGRIAEGGSWVPVRDTGDQWSPGSLQTCKNALVCDFCGGRRQAESAERAEWHFNDWLAGGGQLVGLRVSVSYSGGDNLATTYDLLNGAFNRLSKMPAWRDAGIVDHMVVLHVRYNPTRKAFYPHFHLVAFLPGWVAVDADAMERTLQGAWVAAVERTLKARIAKVERIENWDAATDLEMAWRDRIARGIGRRVSRAHGLTARVLGSAWHALYAWHWADEDEEERDDARVDSDRRTDRLGDYADRWADSSDDDGSWALHRLAEAALDGDPHAWRAWEELCRAMKGVPVVRCSKMLNTVWKARQAELPDPEPQELGDPIVQVHASLWEKARRRGVTQMGLELGRTHGVDAMAQWWKDQLGIGIAVMDTWAASYVYLSRDGPELFPSLN